MAKICAISCTEWPIFCDKQGVKETPTIMVPFVRKPQTIPGKIERHTEM